MLVECVTCKATVDAKVLSSYVDHSELEPPSRFNFAQGPRCNSPFIIGPTDYGGGFDDAWRMYPPADRAPSSTFPAPIRVAYLEALACYKAKAFTATAIMCRKAVEGLCVEHGVNSGNLAAALKQLRGQGIIESRLFEWADALRLSGNEAAHDVRVTIATDDAKDILEFTNALLEYVFTFRDRFTAFKERRSRTAPST